MAIGSDAWHEELCVRERRLPCCNDSYDMNTCTLMWERVRLVSQDLATRQPFDSTVGLIFE